MHDPRFDAIFDAFIAAGNTVIGPRPAVIKGSFDMVWGRGGGSVIEFRDNVSLSAVKISFLNGGGSIVLGRNVTVKGRLEVNRGGSILIDDDTFLNRECDIRGGEGASVAIGKRCLLSNVKVQTSDMHSVLDAKTGQRTNPSIGIAIEDDVWLAEDVKVAKGVRIGAGAIIAAGSLVTRSVAPFCLAGGRPVRVLRSGIRWTRALKKMAPLPAPSFQPSEIPLEKEALRLLVERKEYALVEAAISASIAELGDKPAPIFARWYLTLCRHKLGKLNPGALEMLEGILAERPDHEAARKLHTRMLEASSRK